MVARVTLPDGRVIETTAQAAEGAPGASDFDLSTEKGFRRDFGALERGLVEAGREVERRAAELYVEAMDEKGGRKGTVDLRRVRVRQGRPRRLR